MLFRDRTVSDGVSYLGSDISLRKGVKMISFSKQASMIKQLAFISFYIDF